MRLRGSRRGSWWAALWPTLCAVHCLAAPALAAAGLAVEGPPALRWALWASSGPLALRAVRGRGRVWALGGWALWAVGLWGAGVAAEGAHALGAGLVAAAVWGRCGRAACPCPCGEEASAWTLCPSTSATTVSASPSSSASGR